MNADETDKYSGMAIKIDKPPFAEDHHDPKTWISLCPGGAFPFLKNARTEPTPLAIGVYRRSSAVPWLF
jgi:hypothetical protein